MKEYRLCSIADLPKPGRGKAVWIEAPHPPGMQLFLANMPEGRRRLAVFNIEQGLRVFNDMCPHQAAPLSDGNLADGTLTCSWHYWQFKLEDGSCLLADWGNLKLYKTRIEGNDVFVELEDV